MERVQIVGAEAKDQGGQYFWKMSSGNIVYVPLLVSAFENVST